MRKGLKIVFAFSGAITLIVSIVLLFIRKAQFQLDLFLVLYLTAVSATLISMRAYFLGIDLNKVRMPIKVLLIAVTTVLFFVQLFFSMFFFVPLLSASSITLGLRLLGYFFFVGAVFNFSVLYRLTEPMKTRVPKQDCA
ncbi:MAG: hypothetical protein ACJ75B_22105 [Flavisolibacter sp.]